MTRAIGGGDSAALLEQLRKVPDADVPDIGFRWGKYILSWPGLIRRLITHSPARGRAWLARLKARSAHIAALDFRGWPTSQLLTFFENFLQDGFQDWDLLYLGLQGLTLPLFNKVLVDWLDEPGLSTSSRLFGGLGGVPEVEASLALWDLAQKAGASPLLKAIVDSEADWSLVHQRLRETEFGREFLREWENLLKEHGHHCRGELELSNPRWSETPDYILGLLRAYLHSTDDLRERHRKLAQTRLQVTAQCRAQLQSPVKRWLFGYTLARAQAISVLREVWKNEAVRIIAALRRLLLVLGERLTAQGALRDPSDVFFLDETELRSVAEGQADFDVGQRVQARRREHERNSRIQPPPLVVGRFRPESTPIPAVQQLFDGKTLCGIAVSGGKAVGRARLITRADQQEQVLPGEILVAPFTDPAWTPYFINAAGLVIGQGGVLSHGSIVAREFGLPAVTNVTSAMERIGNGDLLEVDGDNGVVTILEQSARSTAQG